MFTPLPPIFSTPFPSSHPFQSLPTTSAVNQSHFFSGYPPCDSLLAKLADTHIISSPFFLTQKTAYYEYSFVLCFSHLAQCPGKCSTSVCTAAGYSIALLLIQQFSNIWAFRWLLLCHLEPAAHCQSSWPSCCLPLSVTFPGFLTVWSSPPRPQ